MRKKWFSLLLAGVLSISVLSGCNGNENNSETNFMTNEEYLAEYTYKNKSTTLMRVGDPQVFYDKDSKKYYATGTLDGATFKIWSSDDLTTWSTGKTILSAGQVKWGDFSPESGKAGLWGAEIHKRNGKYYLYFSMWANKQYNPKEPINIGVATSDTVDGLYTPTEKPVFDFDAYTIDNNLFTDTDGKNYMLFVRDVSTNIIDEEQDIRESHIYISEMNDDLLSIKAKSFEEATLLARPEQAWEMQTGNWRWNEGCFLKKIGDTYYLFYSGNFYGDGADGEPSKYAIGYATSKNVLGPYVKYEGNPIIQTYSPDLRGPGNNSIFESPDGKEMFTAYHMMDSTRFVAIDRIGIREDGSVYLSGPNMAEQPIPSGTKSGHTLLSDKAKVTVSSNAEGSKAGYINDGEIVVVPKYNKYTWLSETNPQKVMEQYVILDFGKEVTVNSIYIWNSLIVGTKANKVNIEFSDGTKIEKVKLTDYYGGTAIVNINGKKTTSIKITVAEKGFGVGGQQAFGLSEVKVYGK